MHISPSLLDSFTASGALAESGLGEPGRTDFEVLDLAFHPDWAVRQRRPHSLACSIGSFVTTVRFGKLFKLSLLSMLIAGIAASLLVTTGNHIFSRLYGASVAIALVFSMAAAFSEFFRDKEDGEEAVSHEGAVHHGAAHHGAGRLLTLG